jgi:hypothetical protein
MSQTQTTSAIEYFQILKSTFQSAERQEGRCDRFYQVGKDILCLRFAGTALMPYIDAFSHLEISPTSSPDLVICLWESASTNHALFPPPWSVTTDLSPIKEIEGYGRFVFWRDDRLQIGFYRETQTLNALDLQENLAFYTINDVRQLPYFEPAAPLRLILHWWFSTRSIQMVHAAAVGTAAGGLLLVGKSGSGKSTSALACLESELLYAGDDYCIVTHHPEPYVFSLYNTGKLKGKADFQRFPQLLSKVSNLDHLDTEKAILFIDRHYPQKISAGFPLRAILLPKVTGTPHTRLHPLSAAEALRAIAPSTLLQLAGTSQVNLTFLATLVKKLPSYILEVGADLPGIPETIVNLLSHPF